MRYVYVSEPKLVLPGEVNAILGKKFLVVAGDRSFLKSGENPYETLVIRSETMVGPSIKEYFPNLQNIIRVGTGLDNVDLDHCRTLGIRIFNAAGANADAVSDYTITMMLYALRNLHQLDEQAVSSWDRFRFMGESMRDQTIGIVGFGNIGRMLHKKLNGFSCLGFYVYDPYLTANDMPEGVKLVDLAELFQKCSVISLHLPLTEETKHIVDATLISSMPQGAVLINAARGGVVNEEAVIALADEKQLCFIADTVEGEPSVNPKLHSHPRVIITPHIASLTSDSERSMLQVACDNFLQGRSIV